MRLVPARSSHMYGNARGLSSGIHETVFKMGVTAEKHNLTAVHYVLIAMGRTQERRVGFFNLSAKILIVHMFGHN